MPVNQPNKQAGNHLPVLERNHHMLPVTYVPDGLDATVAWPDKDFRFRNTFPYPVYLRTDVHGGTITASVWARVPQNISGMMAPEEPAVTPAPSETSGTDSHKTPQRQASNM